MNIRQLLGDVAIAVLLAIPTVSLARPQPQAASHDEISKPMVEQAAVAESRVDRRISLES